MRAVMNGLAIALLQVLKGKAGSMKVLQSIWKRSLRLIFLATRQAMITQSVSGRGSKMTGLFWEPVCPIRTIKAVRCCICSGRLLAILYSEGCYADYVPIFTTAQ